MANKVLIVEGSDKSKSLSGWREGFEFLLRNAGLAKLPRIIPSFGRDKAIGEFKKDYWENDKIYLLIDLDGPLETKSQLLTEKGLSKSSSHVFFSIQEIEAWFLSQPSILDDFFGKGLNGERPSNRLNKKDPSLFDDAKFELKRITKGTRRGTYMDSIHGPLLLKKLDASTLTNYFPDEFGKLLKALGHR